MGPVFSKLGVWCRHVLLHVQALPWWEICGRVGNGHLPLPLFIVELPVSRQRGETSDKAPSFKPFLKLFLLVVMCEWAAGARGRAGSFPRKNNSVRGHKGILSPVAAMKGMDWKQRNLRLTLMFAPNVTFGDIILKKKISYDGSSII